MKANRALSILSVFTAFILFTGFNSPGLSAVEKHEEKFEKTVSLAKDGQVYLNNVSGNIEVKSWKKDEVKIDAVKISSAHSLEEAKGNAELVKIEVEKEGDTLRIETDYPRMFGRSLNVSVNYTLMVPDKASVRVKSVSGSIILEEIGGTVKANAVSGNIDVRKASKGVDCDAVSGNVEARDVIGDVYLNAISGGITVERIQGSVEAKTVSGDVDMRSVSKAKVVKATVLSGTITYEGDIDPDGRYTMKAHSGDIEMTIPSNSAFDLEASTFSGRIKSDFEITVSGTISKNKIQGEVNRGGAEVDLNTFSGSIYLRKK